MTNATKGAQRRNLRKATLHRESEVSRTQNDGDSDGIATAMMLFAAAMGKKALEPVLLDVRGLCSYTDYLLLLSGRSDRQVAALAEGIREAAIESGHRPLGIEGKGTWTLLDFGEVIVHVFHHPVREHYDIEGLWIDAKRVPLDVPAEARIGVEETYSM